MGFPPPAPPSGLPATDSLAVIAATNASVSSITASGQKIVHLANGSAADDAAAFGQIPAALPTTQSLDQIAAAHVTAADWSNNSKKITGLAGATAATDAASLANTLDQFAAPAANVAMNSKKLTGLASGTASADALTWGQATGRATYSSASTNPTGTASATGVMLGLSSGTTRIAPTLTTSIIAMLNGWTVTSTAGAAINTFALRYGTGNGPTNGAAVTGSDPGGSLDCYLASLADQKPVTIVRPILGLVVGTAYWVDGVQSQPAGGGTATMNGATLGLMEI